MNRTILLSPDFNIFDRWSYPLPKSYPSLTHVLPKVYPRCSQVQKACIYLGSTWVVLGYYLDRVWVERRNMSVRNIKTYIVTKLTVPKIDLDSSTLTFLQCHTIVLVQTERLLVLLNYRTQLIGRRMTDEGLHSCQCTPSCSFSVNWQMQFAFWRLLSAWFVNQWKKRVTWNKNSKRQTSKL